MTRARSAVLAALALLGVCAPGASAAPKIDVNGLLGGLRTGQTFTLKLTASDPQRPIEGIQADFGESGSAVGGSACRSGARTGAFAPGHKVGFALPYAYRTTGVHLITVRVLSGGCDGTPSSTTLTRLATVTLPGLPLPTLPRLSVSVLDGTSAASRCPGSGLMPSRRNAKRVRSATLCLVNAQRRRSGLRGLRRNGRLEHAAIGHSAGMVRARTFLHGAVLGRLRKVGYIGRVAGWAYGENIAYGIGSRATPAAIVAAWMASPPHRANILSPLFREAGIGVAVGAPVDPRHGATYTLDFGRHS